MACALAATATIEWTTPTTHNFGAFSEDMGPASTVFSFVNTGTEPVSILAARASCGCTKPTYTRGEIAPGDTARITVAYNPEGRPGTFSKYVQLETTDPGARKVKLIVKGTVVGAPRTVGKRFPVKAGSLVSLAKPGVMVGQVKKNTMRTAKLEAYNSSTDTLRPSLVGAPRHISMDFAPAKPAPGEHFAMIFYFKADEQPLYGLVEDSVKVDFGDGPHDIAVVAMVEEDFSKLDDKQLAKAPVAEVERSVDLGTIERGSALRRTVRLTNAGRSTLNIRRVYSADSGVTAAAAATELKPGKSTDITIDLAPAATSSDIVNIRVMLITDDPRNPVQPIRLVGTVK